MGRKTAGPKAPQCTIDEVRAILRRRKVLWYETDDPTARKLRKSLGFTRKKGAPLLTHLKNLVARGEAKRSKRPVAPPRYFQRDGQRVAVQEIVFTWTGE